MACGCGGASKELKKSQVFVVTLRDGGTKEVNSEFEARVAITQAGGGTFRLKR